MTVARQKKILKKIQELENNIETLKKARIEALANGFASASIGTGSGSKSYSRFSPEQFTSVIDELLKELLQWRSLLTTGSVSPFKTIVTVYV